MKAEILKLLDRENLSAEELQRALNVRTEVLYQTLVHMEAQGLVTVWGHRKPLQSLWCKAVEEVEA